MMQKKRARSVHGCTPFFLAGWENGCIGAILEGSDQRRMKFHAAGWYFQSGLKYLISLFFMKRSHEMKSAVFLIFLFLFSHLLLFADVEDIAQKREIIQQKIDNLKSVKNLSFDIISEVTSYPLYTNEEDAAHYAKQISGIGRGQASDEVAARVFEGNKNLALHGSHSAYIFKYIVGEDNYFSRRQIIKDSFSIRLTGYGSIDILDSDKIECITIRNTRRTYQESILFTNYVTALYTMLHSLQNVVITEDESGLDILFTSNNYEYELNYDHEDPIYPQRYAIRKKDEYDKQKLFLKKRTSNGMLVPMKMISDLYSPHPSDNHYFLKRRITYEVANLKTLPSVHAEDLDYEVNSGRCIIDSRTNTTYEINEEKDFIFLFAWLKQHKIIE
jgi:hypothetical protein